MFVLSRYPGESIKIGNDIIITVKEIELSSKNAVLSINNPESRSITLGWGQSATIKKH